MSKQLTCVVEAQPILINGERNHQRACGPFKAVFFYTDNRPQEIILGVPEPVNQANWRFHRELLTKGFGGTSGEPNKDNPIRIKWLNGTENSPLYAELHYGQEKTLLLFDKPSKDQILDFLAQTYELTPSDQMLPSDEVFDRELALLLDEVPND